VVTQFTGPLSNEVFDLGVHTLSFLATDSAGNTATCIITLEVLPLLPLNPQVSDVIACKGDEVTLSATPINDAIYIWSGPAGPYPDNNNIIIPSLEESLTGYYSVYANVRGCLTPLDSALVRIGRLPDAVDDLDYQIGTNETLTDFNILLNDIYESDDYTLTVVSPLQGLIEHGNGLFSFEAGNKNTVNFFVYRLCSKTCPDLCDEGIVSIQVRERICSFIPNIITPNGDGINDYLVVPCLDIEPYPQNSLIIYNQWGDRVYEAAPYDNAPDKAWKGELFGEAGKAMPDATYYYIFKASPDDQGLKGFIEVFR
jgi:gliding motility-associated-like protein